MLLSYVISYVIFKLNRSEIRSPRDFLSHFTIINPEKHEKTDKKVLTLLSVRYIFCTFNKIVPKHYEISKEVLVKERYLYLRVIMATLEGVYKNSYK